MLHLLFQVKSAQRSVKPTNGEYSKWPHFCYEWAFILLCRYGDFPPLPPLPPCPHPYVPENEAAVRDGIHC